VDDWYVGAYVEKRNKYVKKICVPVSLYLQDFLVQFNPSKPNGYFRTKRPTSSDLRYTHTVYYTFDMVHRTKDIYLARQH